MGKMNMQHLPSEMPIPPGAVITHQSSLLQPVSPQNVQTSPTPNITFPGTTDDGTKIPPDGGGAVGPNHVMAVENHIFVIRSKTGTFNSSMSGATFFSGLTPEFFTDPHVKYDQYAGRWIVIGQSNIVGAASATCSWQIAVSLTNDPTGTWFKYVIKADPASAQVMDFPLLGYNKNWIVVTSNLFNSALTAFTGTSLFVLDKANLYAGGAVNFATNAFRLLNPTSEGFTACPLVTFSTGTIGDEMYICQPWAPSTGTLRISKVSGTLPALTYPTNPVFPQLGGYGAGPSATNIAPQLGDTRKINNLNDVRVCSFIERNNAFWGCNHAWDGVAPNDRSVVNWFQITPAGGITQKGKIDLGAGIFTAFPSLSVTATEDVLIGYSKFSATMFATAAYSYRTAATPVNTLDNDVQYKNGLSAYYKTFGGTNNRWGDYSSTALDPVTGSLWTKQEYAEQRVGTNDVDSRFGTWWAEVIPLSANAQRDALIAAIITPAQGSVICNTPVIPRVTLRNGGTDPLTSVTIGMKLDGVVVGTPFNFTGNLASFTNVDLNMSAISPTPGLHTLKVYTSNPNGLTDQRPSNDTTTITFTILQTIPLPNVEGFESTTFPPPGGWTLFGPAPWARSTAGAKTGVASAFQNGWTNGTVGAVGILKTPKIDISTLDSIKISFDISYGQYNAVGWTVDTLEVVYSLDCGTTWLPTGYKKWSTAAGGLTTVPEVGGQWVPTAASWRTETINMGTCTINSPSVMVGVKWTNGFGNNLFIDNFSISGVTSLQRNAAMLSISDPFQFLCTADPTNPPVSFTPVVTIANRGSDVITTLKVNYRVDNGPVIVFNYTGALVKCTSVQLTLPVGSTGPGSHILTVFTSDPNGLSDQFLPNDTLRKTFIVFPYAAATSISEGFEATTFPANGWGVFNPDGLVTYEKTTAASRTGAASMVIRNFNYQVSNTFDQFISPQMLNTGTPDSIFTSFDYAYSPGARYPGSTVFPLDTLEISVTQDCGKTFKTIWKKWGEDLQTLGDPLGPNNSDPVAFLPTAGYQWKNIRLFLTPFVGSNKYQVVFTAKSNRQNNLYVDNINIKTQTLPVRLKTQGYLIYPSPFRNMFTIHHYLQPVNLNSVSVYNSVGQLILKKDVNGSANTEMNIDLSKYAPGVYIVKLQYADKTVVERIVKE